MNDVTDPESPPPVFVDRSLRRWVALPIAIALITIVALGSRSTSLAPLGGPDMGFLLTALEVVGYVGVIVGLGGALLAAALYRQRRAILLADATTRRPLPALPLWAQILGVLFFIGVIVGEAIVVLAYLSDLLRNAGRGADPGTSGLGSGLDANAIPLADREVIALAIAFVIVVSLGVVVLALNLRWRLADDRREAANDRGQGARRAVEVSLEALGREPDPRRAIIAAYAAMERSLSSAGLARDVSEAPFEYLRRVLARWTRATDEVRTITHLFQVAKFSDHRVDEGMRSDAIGALERIRSAMSVPR